MLCYVRLCDEGWYTQNNGVHSCGMVPNLFVFPIMIMIIIMHCFVMILFLYICGNLFSECVVVVFEILECMAMCVYVCMYVCQSNLSHTLERLYFFVGSERERERESSVQVLGVCNAMQWRETCDVRMVRSQGS